MTAGTAERAYQFARAGNVARWARQRLDPVQRTPPGLFRILDAEFGFTLDAAATPANAKCARYFTVDDDALGQEWGAARVWLNPPFGAGLHEWMRKAWESSRAGALVVCLVPSATDSSWWHDWVLRAAEVRFIRGRVSFLRESGARGSNAFFPVSIVVFRPAADRERHALPLLAPSSLDTGATTAHLTEPGKR